MIEDEEFGADEFYVIYDGRIAVEIVLDKNNYYEIDYLRKGSLIRPYHFLANRINRVRYKVVEQCLIYKLRLEVLILLSVDYPQLKERLAPAIAQ